MLQVIDKYIIKQFLLYFLSGLAIFTSIFVAIDYMSQFMSSNADALSIIKYYGFSIPAIIYQMLPISCLLSTVFTLMTLNRSNELVALLSLGHSLARVCAPILVIVALVSSFSFWLADKIMPQMAEKKNYVYYVEIKKSPSRYRKFKTSKIWYRSGNSLLNIRKLDPIQSVGQTVSIYDFDENWKIIQLTKASEAKISPSGWLLKDGLVTLFSKETSFPITQSFSEKRILVNQSVDDLRNSSFSPETLGVGELRQLIEKNKKAGLNTRQFEVNYHASYGYAFAAFVMTLIGIPFSVKRRRSGGAMISVGLCIGLAFLYWALYSSSLAMGRHGGLPPMAAAWAPNVLIMSYAAYLLNKLKM